MLNRSDNPGAAVRHFLPKIFLLCALGAALLLAACAQTGNAAGANNAASDAVTAEAQGLQLASLITPAPTQAGPDGASTNGQAPALFGGQIEEIITNGGENVWQVGGRAVHITSGTTINDSVGQPQVGAHVTIGGSPRSDGGVDAAWARVDDAGTGVAATPPVTVTNSPANSAPQTASNNSPSGAATAVPAGQAPAAGGNEAPQASAVYCGYIEQRPQSGIVGDWRVSNRTVRVGQDTQVVSQDNRFDLGWFTYIRGTLQGDGSLTARQMWVRPPGNNRCLPGLRVGQNNGAPGVGNGRANGKAGNPGRGNNGDGNGNGNGKDKGNGNGNGNGKGKGH